VTEVQLNASRDVRRMIVTVMTFDPTLYGDDTGIALAVSAPDDVIDPETDDWQDYGCNARLTADEARQIGNALPRAADEAEG